MGRLKAVGLLGLRLLGCTVSPPAASPSATPALAPTPAACKSIYMSGDYLSPPRPVPSVAIAQDALSGSWYRIFNDYGTRPAPGAADGCSTHYAYAKVIEQTPRGIVIREAYNGDFHAADAYNGAERLAGTYVEGRLRLSGEVSQDGTFKSPEPVTYDLRYEPATQHLVGTRNGAPMTWVPLYIANPCPTPLPYCSPPPP